MEDTGFKGQGIFLYPKAFRPSVGHTQPPFEGIPVVFPRDISVGAWT